jgi:hypothetical protein
MHRSFTRSRVPVDGIPDPHYHNPYPRIQRDLRPEEELWKAGQFGGLKREAPFFEAAFNSRLAEKMVQAGYGIRRTDRDFELSSVSRELVEKSSKRTQLIEQLAREKYAMLAAFGRPSERLRITRSHPDHLYLLE